MPASEGAAAGAVAAAHPQVDRDQASSGRRQNPLQVLYQDDWLLAVHKPAGLLLHRSEIDRHETEFALQYARALNGGQHVYPVHRLDRPTSGLLLFARDPQTAGSLGRRIMAGEVEKHYLAVVRGWLEGSGTIDRPLRERPVDRRDRGSEQPVREAVTDYRCLATVEIPEFVETYPTSRYSLVALNPRTGRKHQLRRHMQHAGHPIIGDTTYGRTRHNRYFADRFGHARLMLAAVGLQLAHPVTGAPLRLHAPLEDSFVQGLGIFPVLPEELESIIGPPGAHPE
ncbi:MAG: pseudouridine synthase [Halothiobacillaceae bacterium]